MPRPRKHAETIVKSFSLDRQIYERLKQDLAVRGRSISEEVNELLHRRLAEIEGLEASTQDAQNYDALKREHVKLAEEVNRLIKLLQKDGTYDQLMETVAELGLDTELKQR
jgi:predicted CopG family antitoxin